MLDRKYVEQFESMFMMQYETCHRLDPTKLRNVSKFFGHLLHTDGISWGVLQVRVGMPLSHKETDIEFSFHQRL